MPMIGRRFYPGLERGMMGSMQSGDFPVPVLWLKFGEGAGDALKDSSPEGNDGMNYGATWVKGYLGPGLSFDGLDDSVVVADDPSLRITDAITIVSRVSTTLAAVNYIASILAKGTASYFLAMGEYVSDAPKVTGFIYISKEWKYLRGDTAINDGLFHQAGMTYDGEYLRVYRDGLSDATPLAVSGAITSDVFPIYLARYSTGRTKAIFDEILVFPEALSARQMLELHYGIR